MVCSYEIKGEGRRVRGNKGGERQKEDRNIKKVEEAN
jgi:hypothetical protein